jgi:hypothetical protein
MRVGLNLTVSGYGYEHGNTGSAEYPDWMSEDRILGKFASCGSLIIHFYAKTTFTF